MSDALITTASFTAKLQGLGCGNVGGSSLLFSDNFESGDLSHTENGVFYTGNANVSVITDPTDGANKVAQFKYAGNVDGDAWAELRFDLGDQYSVVTLEWDSYIPANYLHRDSTGVDNNKFFRLWPTDYGDLQKVGASLRRNAISSVGEDYVLTGNSAISTQVTSAPSFIAASDLGVWRALKVEVVAPTVSVDGSIKFYKDGSLFHSAENIAYHAGGTAGYRYGYLWGWANSGFAVDTDILMDNLKFYGSL